MNQDSSVATDILEFWFGASGSPAHGTPRDVWFKKDQAFDAAMRARFLSLWERARSGAFIDWHSRAFTLLAFIVLCDQFPRNMFRGQALAFATDADALRAARLMTDRDWDRERSLYERVFIYLPFEHAESLTEQDRAVELFSSLRGTPDGDNYYDYALRHRAVIARFGRFPHRNQALGRASTPEEADFLAQPGSGF